MRKTLFAVAVMAMVVTGFASSAAAAVPEMRPFVGAFIPTGAQRDLLNDAFLIGMQGGVELSERVHFLGTFAWSPRNKSEDAAIYQYDAGVETFRPFQMTQDWQLRPFVGLGLGGRTYADGANDNHKETNFTGYGSLGAEFQLNRLAVRIEGRDYLSRFQGLAGELSAKVRNDVNLMSAVAIHF